MPKKVGRCSKYFLFGLNLGFAVLSFVLLCIGIWAWAEKFKLDGVTTIIFDPVLFINFVGVTMFLLSLAGSVGSLRENITILKFFKYSMCAVLLVTISGTIVCFAGRGWLEGEFSKYTVNALRDYRDNPDIQNIVDAAQTNFQCCGAVSPDDWDNNPYFNCTNTIQVNGKDYHMIERCGVPSSCCIRDHEDHVLNTQCGYGVRDRSVFNAQQLGERIYFDGCIETFSNWLHSYAMTIITVMFFVIVLEITQIFVAHNVIEDIEKIMSRW